MPHTAEAQGAIVGSRLGEEWGRPFRLGDAHEPTPFREADERHYAFSYR